MKDNIIQYSFSEKNTNTLVFVPGYNGGLETLILKSLIEYYVSKGSFNIFGLHIPYDEDIQDIFSNSQKKLVSLLDYIKSETPNTNIILFAKSLGGSLALYNHEKLPINKLILLGCSIVLGWPQRISILSTENIIIPNYKLEWADTFKKVNIPLLIISGDKDDLCDNEFLVAQSKQNLNIDILIIKNTNHDLMSLVNERFEFDECVSTIAKFISRD